MKKDDFAFEIKNTLEEGTTAVNLIGKPLRIYRFTESFCGVPDIAEGLGLHALESGVNTRIASSNIHTTNGYKIQSKMPTSENAITLKRYLVLSNIMETSGT